MVAAASPDRAAALPESPFKGLAAFEASALDAMLFFGREREREIITANLLASRATVLYGATGVGKSSILRAGVAHQLHQLDGEGAAAGRGRELAVVVFGSWSGDPLQGLRTAIEAELFGDSQDAAGGGGALADDLQAWTEGLGLDLYLILDQAEEYFVYHGSEGADAPFVRELAELLAWPGLRVNCLLALREEALATLDVFKARVPNLLTNRLRLEHLDREAGRAAVVGPVDVYNRLAPVDRRVRLEPELVEAVLDEVATGALDYGRAGRGRASENGARSNIEAPFLQLVMQRLWEVEQAEGSGALSLETLRRLGGGQRVVEDHLERALATLTPHEQDDAAEMFRYLVTPSGTKIAHEVSDLRDYVGAPEPELERVLATLSTERILRPVSDGGNGGGRYEIFHDVLADAVLAWRGGHEARREVEDARREADRRHRRALVIAGVAVFGLALMAAITVFALAQRSSARAEARRAHARELVAGALGSLATDPQRSLASAVRAARFERSPAVEDALRQALLASHQRFVLRATKPVTTASFSSDRGATRAIVGSEDGTARLYDARTGRPLHRFDAGGAVVSAAFGAGTRLVATGSKRGWVRVWDTRNARLLLSHRTGGRVGSVSFSGDGRLLLAASNDRNARIWHVGDDSAPLRIHREGAVLDAAFSPHGGSRILLRTPNAAWIFDRRSGLLLHELQSGGTLLSAAFSPDGTTVVTTYKSKKALLWNALTGTPRATLRGHRGWVTDAAFSPHGAYVVTASSDGSARVWKVHRGEFVAVLPGHTNHVATASFSHDGQWVITGSRDRTARIFQATSGRLVAVLAGHRDSVVGAEYASTGNRVITASTDGTARIWDPGTERELSRWRDSAGRLVSPGAHPKPVTTATFASNGERVVITSRDGTARVVTAAGDPVAVLRNGAPVLAGALSRDGRLVATGDANGVVRVWRVADRHRLALFRAPAAARTVAFAPRGRSLLIASGSAALLWNWPDHSRPRRFGDSEIASAAFSPDGRLVVTADGDWTAKVWNARTGVRVRTLEGHRGAVTAASFSPDGRMVATASRDDDGRIWRLANGSSVPLRGHDNVVNDAQFSPDGRWVVTAGPKNVGLWPTKSGLLLLYLRGHVEPVTSASFSPDGTRVLTSSEDGTVRMYRCDICSGLDGLLALAKRRLAGFGS